MTPAIGLTDVRHAADVFGVHGTTGRTHWKCLAGRLALASAVEAFEFAELPPDGVSGAHVHTRTEELYFILAGVGRIEWDGGSRRVRGGDLIVTPLGGQHGLTNIGTDPLEWLVLEVYAAPQRAALLGQPIDEPTRKEGPVPLQVVTLREGEQFDARNVLEGPIGVVERVRLARGDERELRADDVEYSAFVMSGSGTGVDGTTAIDIAPGMAVTLPLGTRVMLRAGDEPLELFVVCLAVDAEAAA